MQYPINEMFSAFQGEGIHMGRKAFFIRSHGCPVKCSFCDSAGTWHPKYKQSSTLHHPGTLARAIGNSGARLVIITGGEPALFDWSPLVLAAERDGIQLEFAMETSGALPIKWEPDWVTLSPKPYGLVPLRPESAAHANEFKLILTDLKSFRDNLELLVKALLIATRSEWELGSTDDPEAYFDSCARFLISYGIPVWLHPEWGHRNDPETVSLISRLVTQYGDPFRAGYQLHKLYKCDDLDSRTRPKVPLGGVPEQGY